MPVKTVTIQVTALTDKANRNIAETGAYFERLRKANPVELSVKFDKLQAQAEAKILAKELSQTVNDKVKLDTSSFGAQLQKLADKMKAGGGPAWLGPALLSLPAVTSLLGAATGAAIGLGGAFVAGGGALAAFGAIAKPVLADALTAAQAVNTAQNNYAVAIAAGVKPATAWRAEQIAIGKAYAELSPQQIALSRQLGNMANAWQNLKAAETPVVAGALQPWLRSVTDLTTKLSPIIHAVAVPIKEIGAQVDILINSSAFTTFRNWIAGTGTAAVGAVGSALTGFLDAVVTILPQFNPLIEKAVGWISGLGPAMAHWANSQKTADDIRKFMDWFSQNGPVVGGLLKNIGAALKVLAPGLTTGGITELKLISDFFGLIARLPPGLAGPVAELAGALLLLNKLGVVSVGLKILGLAGIGGAAEGAAAGGLLAKILGPGVKLVGGVFILTMAIRFAGSFVPKDLSKQVAADAAKQPSFAMKIDDLLHLTNIAGWIDANFSHPVRAFLKNDVPQAFGEARAWIETNFVQVLVRFFTSTLPTAFDLWKESVRLVFDKVKTLALDTVLGISVAFGHLPGPLGAPFRSASTAIRADLAKIQGDAANAAANINADWDKLHGKTVTLHFAFAGFPGQPPPGLAAGTTGASPGWHWVGERGPELVRMSGGEVVVPNHKLGGYANGVGDFAGQFPSSAQIGAGFGAIQHAVNGITSQQLHITAAQILKAAIGSGVITGAGAGVQRWAGTALRAMAMLGIPASDIGIVLSQMTTESGGNPYAVNLTDSNAAAGIPSTGLMQVVSPTYARWGAPWFGYPAPVANMVSENPLANIFAGLNYAIHRYGAGWTSVLGHGHGYDAGGLLMPGLTLARNSTSRPESVLGSRAEDLLDEIAGRLASVEGLLAAGNQITASVGPSMGAVLAGGARAAAYGALYPVTDSLIIGESIELIGSVASTNPLCTGAVFLLQPGYDLGAPQPVTSIVGSLLLDGSRPFGYQAGNRTITLPIEISVPGDSGTPAGFQTLTAAREVLLREINQQTWTLRWTRDPGTGTALPLLFDCFRAHATVVAWGGVDTLNRFPIGLLTISFDALPYGRNDLPVVVDFPSPLAGRTAPPAAVTVDSFSSVSGSQWAASAQSPVAGGQSAFWDPGISPLNNPDGVGAVAQYIAGAAGANLAAGWNLTAQGTALTANYVIATAAAAAVVSKGDQFQLWNAGVLLQTQIFTVTSIGPPVAGFRNVFFSPNASAVTVLNNHAIQTGPAQLPALTFWAGFGSSVFYPHWARLGGRVTFAVTLIDTYGMTLTFSKTVKVTGSNNTLAPRWNKIRVPVPFKAGFDYANVSSYNILATNRATGDMRYTQMYLSQLLAVPPPVTVAPSPARGTVYELAGLPGTARAPVSLQFQQTGSRAYVSQFTVPGTHQWTCPPGVTSVAVFAIGGGEAGANFDSGANGGGGGGGGGSAANAAVAVTAGNTYTLNVGAGGSPDYGYPAGIIYPGTRAADSVFTGDVATVTAHHGIQGTISAGGAGGAAGTGGFAGGTGGAGTAATTGGGGAGGGSGGTAAAGNTGGAAAGGTGGAPAAVVAGGGPGGAGGTKNIGNGHTPNAGYGGGAGGSPGGAFGSFGHGSGGLVQLTYTSSQPGFQTLIAHRPPVTAPDTLLPFVSPSPADPADGSIQYPVASLVPGANARFAGTYTVVLVAWAWHTTTSKTLTVQVTQWEQPGGASYTSSAAATVTPSTFPVCSGTNANFGPLVVIGELTLPVQDLPQDNTNAYFTVSVTSTDTADQFQDVLFLDTLGSSVIIQSPTLYAQMFLDEPASDRDIGLVMGSLYDRADAVSILDRATVAGGPVSVDPDGNPHLLVYAAEGAPNLQMSYFPRWHLDRIT